MSIPANAPDPACAPGARPRLIAAFMLIMTLLIPRAGHAAADMLADTDLQGDAYRSFELIAPVPDFCRKVCEKDEGCRAWTFSWPGKKGKRAKCFLKRSVAEKRKDTCCISGYKKRSIASTLGNTVRNWLNREGSSEQPTPDDTNGDTLQPQEQPQQPPASPARAPRQQAEPRQRPQPDAQDEAMLAEKRDFCRRYAQAARDANRAARQLGCGFAGGLWGASFNGYFNWCMKNSPQRADRNTERRAAALQQCRAGLASRRRDPGFDMPQFPPDAAYDERLRDLYGRFRQPRQARQPRDPRWRRARFVYSWLRRAGPAPRMTPWRPTFSGKCPLVRACECPQGDTCRVYEPGSIAVYWPLGCDGPPAYVICRVRRR